MDCRPETRSGGSEHLSHPTLAIPFQRSSLRACIFLPMLACRGVAESSRAATCRCPSAHLLLAFCSAINQCVRGTVHERVAFVDPCLDRAFFFCVCVAGLYLSASEITYVPTAKGVALPMPCYLQPRGKIATRYLKVVGAEAIEISRELRHGRHGVYSLPS